MKIILGLCILIALFAFLGPKPKEPDFSAISLPEITSDLIALEDSINTKESAMRLKPDNEARIHWHAPYKKTAYSIVYLHGNGASQEEGDPFHEALAHRYGCNLFLARLEGHGLDDANPMLNIDPVQWMQSALDALAIGHAIGEKVILVSCSTGSTFSLYLSAHYPELIDGQILFSPNIDLYDPRSFIMQWPWGLQIGRLILGSDFYGWEAPGTAQQYWYTRYRIEGLITLKSILQAAMTEETFSNIRQPLFMSYYYQNEDQQDKIVSVSRMQEMFDQLSTPNHLKQSVALKHANTHIISSDIFNQQLDELWYPMIAYCENILGLTPVNESDWQPFLDIR